MSRPPDEPPLPVFRFVGHSGSGKTTLIERLVAALTARGLRAAVAKDTHHRVDLDQRGKDTWRFAQSGAADVILTSPGHLTLFERRPDRPPLRDVARLVADRADLLLAEGYRDDADYPAILVWRAAVNPDLPALQGPICAVVADAPTALKAPAFAFEDFGGLLDHLLNL